MGTSVVKSLSSEQVSQVEAAKAKISYLGGSNNGGFRFLAGFDGTNNDSSSVPKGEYQTNVANVIKNAQLPVNPNLGLGYYPGVGTGGQNGNLFAAAVSPTDAIHYAAESALAEFVRQARGYLIENPKASYADVSTSIIGFSRGCATGIVFAQILNERGLIAADGTVIAPPGAVKVHGMALLDPVHTFVAGDMNIPSNVVGEVLVVRAANELRRDFPAAGYEGDSRAVTVLMPGNHVGIGGGYDLNGTGAAVLEGVTNYLRNSGVALAPVPDALRFDPTRPVALYTEEFQTARNGDVVRDENGMPLKSWRSDDAAEPRRTVVISSNGTDSAENVPPAGYCYVAPDGKIYELLDNGTLRREIPWPIQLVEIRHSNGEGCLYDTENHPLTTLRVDERLELNPDGLPCVVQPNGSSQNFAEVMADTSRAIPQDLFFDDPANLQPLPDDGSEVPGDESLIEDVPQPDFIDDQPDDAAEYPQAPSGAAEADPLPAFAEYLASSALTGAQEAPLASELDRQNIGSVGDLAFVRMPDGSYMLQNPDGDIVGQLHLQTDGALRWSGLAGERRYIQPDGTVQDQHAADQNAAAAELAAADAHNAAQAAGALGLLNAIVGLQHWDAMTDVQRAAAVVSIYQLVDKLNGGALPGELGGAAAALGLFSALERGDVGGAVYSGLSLVEAVTSTAQTAGLVTQNFGGSFLPALSMVLAVSSGDPVAIAASGLALMSAMSVIGPWGTAAGAVLSLANLLFSDQDIPSREGLAHAQWDASGHLQIVTDLDTEGGGASAAGWIRGLAEDLQARLEGTGSSLVPGLLPAVGFSLDPDGPAAAHAAPGFVYLKWVDTQGQEQTRYYDGQGNRNDGSGETLAGDFMRHAADAVAPDWAVATVLAHWQEDRSQRPHLPDAAMPDIDTDGLHQTLHALVLGGLAEARQAQFDTDLDGFLERTQWLGKQQAALALDADADGVVAAGELVDARGGALTDLDWLDANRDGILDRRDPAFAALRLWVDADATGRSHPNGSEVRTLAQAGIVAIDFRTDPPTALHDDGRREVFGAQQYVGDVLGHRYDPVEGGVLQRMEQADGGVSLQLLAINTHAFDGQAEHTHQGLNIAGAQSAVEAGDSRLVSTGANTTTTSHRRTTTTLTTGDARIDSGSAGVARTGQTPGAQRPDGPSAVVKNSGERGIAVMFADGAAPVGPAMRDATAAMVRSAESGSLFGSGGAGLLGVLAAGMAAWPALSDAASTLPAVGDARRPGADHVESALQVLPARGLPADRDGDWKGVASAIDPTAESRSLSPTGTGLESDQVVNPVADPTIVVPLDANHPTLRSSLLASPLRFLPSATRPSPDGGLPEHRDPTAAATVAVFPESPRFVLPTAVGEQVEGVEDTVLRWSAASLLANDASRNAARPDTAGLHISAVFAPRHGRVSLQADAAGEMQVVFVPDADHDGEAGFSYTVADVFGLESRAETTVHITPVNDAPVARGETAYAEEDRALYFRVADLLANDQDVDGDALQISRVGVATHGQVFLQADGVVRFVPDVDYHGPASFSYWVADRDAAGMLHGPGLETAAIAHLTLLPVNDLPVATGEMLASDEDVVLRIAPGLLLGNDTDVDIATDGQRLSVVAVGGARHGSVSLSPDGSIVFVPEPDYFGPASFGYTIDDGAGGRAEAIAVIQLAAVNDAPEVAGETIAFAEDQAQTLSQASLLANDFDVDNPLADLRVVAVSHAEHGSVRLNAAGDVVFVPDPDYFGPAAFDYTVADGAGGFTVGRVRLDISPVNDAPRLLGERVAIDEDEVAHFTSAALLANDSDVDDPHAALSIMSVGGAEHGSVVLRDGAVVFKPDRDYHGAARFSYTVSDGAGGSSEAWVDLDLRFVNDAPTLNGESLTAKAGVAYTFTPSALLANDADADGDMLRIVEVRDAKNGTVAMLPDGGIRFVPEVGTGGGSGSFEYVVEDGAGARSTAIARIDFSRANQAPVATDDSFIGYEDVPLVIDAGQLLSNDRDADNTAVQLRLAGVDNATHGRVGLDSDGNVRFVPDTDYAGPASFRYRVIDGDGGESYATAYLRVAAVNDAPVIEDIWYGRPVYGYGYQTVQRYNELGQMVTDDVGRFLTEVVFRQIEDEASARSLWGQGQLYQRDGSTLVAGFETYRNGQWRPTAFDTGPQPREFATDQTGRVIAYDPDGDSEKISFGIAITPQHGHAWANLHFPHTPLSPGSGDTPFDPQDFKLVPSLSVADKGAWQYINVIGDLYTGADPFALRLTDADGASAVVTIDTRHLGLHYLPSSGGWFPIAIDLGDDGVALIRPQDSKVLADVNGDGRLERIGWTAASDAMLVFDADGDGVVDLVKDSDFARYGNPGATDLEGLAAFDTDGDGRISAGDATWARLGVFQDRNGDGRQDEGEFRSLAAEGIDSIGLGRGGDAHRDKGNVVFGYTDVRWSDGHVSKAADVMLAGEGIALPERVQHLLERPATTQALHAEAAPLPSPAVVTPVLPTVGSQASLHTAGVDDGRALAQSEAMRTALVFAQCLNTQAADDRAGAFGVVDLHAGDSGLSAVQALLEAARHGVVDQLRHLDPA
ncbi:tandem-95 repeat protein [Xylophilus sp. Kf1]|nr:tandem-95 repeat protein [Xylophilus sp. Kf1]